MARGVNISRFDVKEQQSNFRIYNISKMTNLKIL